MTKDFGGEHSVSKSLSFCKLKAQDISRSCFTDRPWDNAVELTETKRLFDKFLLGVRNLCVDGDTDGNHRERFNVRISFNCDADFDYFTSESVVHDGTLLFAHEAIERCIAKVCCAQTYYLPAGKPEDGDTINYTVGNFVILNEYDGDFIPAEKPWMRERTTVLLPIKMTKD